MSEISSILEQVKAGKLSVKEVEKLLLARSSAVADMGFARLDLKRGERKGAPETVFCQGKKTDHLVAIFSRFADEGLRVMGTRATPKQAEKVLSSVEGTRYDEVSRIIFLGGMPKRKSGCIAVCTGGTADVPVAEEAAQTAEFLGNRVKRFYDVGVAGIHRLLSVIDEVRTANCVIAIAGMEGALASVVGGLVSVPVIAVPTSVGYGASFSGLAPLLSMLNSCAEGVSVVNVDNGFGAGYTASRINFLAVKTSKQAGKK